MEDLVEFDFDLDCAESEVTWALGVRRLDTERVESLGRIGRLLESLRWLAPLVLDDVGSSDERQALDDIPNEVLIWGLATSPLNGVRDVPGTGTVPAKLIS